MVAYDCKEINLINIRFLASLETTLGLPLTIEDDTKIELIN